MSGPVAPYLSHGAAGQDADAWRPESVVIVGEPPAGELARRLNEADVEVLRPGELVQFSLAAAHLAAWADGRRRAAEARLVALMAAR
jgi:hypothetical protein